jgi:hypothetical protein
LETVQIYSDETGLHTGGKYFLIGGVIFEKTRRWTRHQLLHAESVSLKGKKDWHATKNQAQRVKYIETITDIAELRGCVFHDCYRNNAKNYWSMTVDSLDRALTRFSCQQAAIVFHQGFNSGSRNKLQKDLRERGHDVSVASANQENLPEVRLADAVCGYLGVLESRGRIANAYPDCPEWLVDLKQETLPHF